MRSLMTEKPETGKPISLGLNNIVQPVIHDKDLRGSAGAAVDYNRLDSPFFFFSFFFYFLFSNQA